MSARWGVFLIECSSIMSFLTMSLGLNLFFLGGRLLVAKPFESFALCFTNVLIGLPVGIPTGHIVSQNLTSRTIIVPGVSLNFFIC